MKASLKILIGLIALFTLAEAHAMRWYSPATGRWFSRDPIHEPGFAATHTLQVNSRVPEPNLYGFVRNRPINDYDYLGLFCCSTPTGTAWYNPITHCCCKGSVIKREHLPIGFKSCSLGFDHGWIEMSGGSSAGFYPNGSIWGDPGQIQSPDSYSKNPNKRCRDITLSPCNFDFDKVKQRIQALIARDTATPPNYNVLTFNCFNWVDAIIEEAARMEEDKGCTKK